MSASDAEIDDVLAASRKLTDQARSVLEEVRDRSAKHGKLVGKAFPSIECLQCGFYDFDVMPNVKGPSDLQVVTIACQRCGLLEQHLINRLEKAIVGNKVPIPLEKRRDKK